MTNSKIFKTVYHYLVHHHQNQHLLLHVEGLSSASNSTRPKSNSAQATQGVKKTWVPEDLRNIYTAHLSELEFTCDTSTVCVRFTKGRKMTKGSYFSSGR